jgi:hypothetical protein
MHCGEEFLSPICNIKNGYGLYCSRRCRALATDKYPIGEFTWKGGEHLHWGKYWSRLVKGKYVRRSRLVMEKHIGRALHDDEIIHHANGDTKDDRIENLILTTRSEHIRHHNLVRYRGRGCLGEGANDDR